MKFFQMILVNRRKGKNEERKKKLQKKRACSLAEKGED